MIQYLYIHVNGSAEYDDDTSIVPRSTTVIAKRLPAIKSGRGGAARYVSGKMPQNARREGPKPAATKPAQNTGPAITNGTETEEERIAAMFRQGADQWAQEQQEMAKLVPKLHRNRASLLKRDSATPIFNGDPRRGKLGNAPDHPPPVGYICYRCGEKGHWIQACPTNNDPNFDGRPRVKRTTGIPRSFLKTVERPKDQVNDGTVDDTKQPSGVMVNAEGEWVVAEPDKATWDRYQAKAQVSAAAQKAAVQGSKELQERGIECPIDNRLFVNPTKTPCCQKTFCHECITNALVENDLKCPVCYTEDVPVDNLPTDMEMAEKVRAYQDEQSKQEEDAKRERSKTPEKVKSEPGSPHNSSQDRISQDAPKSPSPDSGFRKRRASSDLSNDRKAAGPLAVNGNATSQVQPNTASTSTTQANSNANTADFTGGPFPFMNGNMVQNGFNPMAFPNMNNFIGLQPNMNMNMNMNSMGMNFQMPNPMMMGMNTDWNNMWNGGFNPQAMGIGGGMGMNNGMMNNNNMYGGQQNMYNPSNTNNNNNGMHHGNGMPPNAKPPSFFANQQRSANDEDSPYFRKPVNPHRHQGRRNLNRPTDYREI